VALIDDPHADPRALAAALQRWLRARPGQAHRTVQAVEPASRVNGFSNETWRVTLDDPHEVVALRLPPAGAGLFPRYDLARQFGFMQALGQEHGLAMAPVLWLEPDARALGRPFFATAWVPGRAAADRPCYVREGWIAEASPAEQRHMWRAAVEQLARLARVDARRAPYAGFDDLPAGSSLHARHIAHWDALARWGRAQLPPQDSPLFDELRDWLLRHAPSRQPAGIVWGDARFGNILFRGFQPAALLDWELAVIGDPMLDIAYFQFHVFLMELLHADALTPGRFAGFDGDEATLQRWCEAAGRDPQGYRWCWLFNAWKMLAIWECKAALLLRTGHATLEEALAERAATRLVPHIRSVWDSTAPGEQAAFLRPQPAASSSPAPAAA